MFAIKLYSSLKNQRFRGIRQFYATYKRKRLNARLISILKKQSFKKEDRD